MAEAKIKLPNGTEVAISGSPEEIAKVVSLYNDAESASAPSAHSRPNRRIETSTGQTGDADNPSAIDLAAIINTINDCDEAELIERNVLDHSDIVNRILMCLFINEKYFHSIPPMTTGDISKILRQLGVPVSTANVSKAISRKANSYIMYDGIRTKGAVIRYSLNRRGLQYLEGLLNGSEKAISPPSRKAAVTKKKPTESKTGTVRKSKSPSRDLEKPAAKSKKSDAGYRPKFNNQLDLLGLEDFIRPMNLKNNTEYLVAFCKFLKEKVGIEVTEGHDIFTCFSELKSIVKIPGSFLNTLRNAQNRDHVITYDPGFSNVGLTPKGENLFNHDIIKRGKVDDG